MKRLFAMFVIVAAVVLPMLATARPAAAADCCAIPSAVNCYACGLGDPQSVLQQKADPDPVGRWERAGVLASAEIGLQVNFTGYGMVTVSDPVTRQITPDRDVTPLQRGIISRVAGTGY